MLVDKRFTRARTESNVLPLTSVDSSLLIFESINNFRLEFRL